MRFPFDPLPEGFVLAKPIQWGEYDELVVYDLEQRGDLLKTRKRDGWKLFVVSYRGKIKIYTSGLNEVDSRFDHLKKEFTKLDLPPKTVLVGEGVLDRDDADDISVVGQIFQSDETTALRLQEEYGKIHFIQFGVVFFEGKPVVTKPYHEILKLISDIHARSASKLHYLKPVQVLDMPYDAAKALVREKEWEGLVLYDKHFINSYRLDGKNPERPEGCYKWKPLTEGDFIVRSWIPSQKDSSRFKDVALLQIDPVTGEEFACRRYGSFTNAMKKHLMEEAEYPLVIEFEYDTRFPKSGKLRTAYFKRLRPDKRVSECVAPKSYPNAEYV
ncbi:MAG: hypothetical protein Q7R73_00270 [bacterium]|nr:hypothetical protein [bacterium]